MSLSRSVLRASAQATVARPAARAPLASIARASYRQYSSGSNGSSSGKKNKIPAATISLLGLGSVGAYFGLSQEQQDPATTQEGMRKPGSEVDYQQVYNSVAAVLDSEDYDDGSYGPTLVRLAWHCSGTYDKNTGNGGSNGSTMRFAPESDHGANAGLKVVRDLLDPIKKQYPGLSYSDLWTLAGVVAVQEMQGPKIGWRSGREDRTAEHCTPDGRLPDGDKGSDHLRHIFYKMGFNDRAIVALSGAHALGRCHTDRSGFDGPWTFSPTTFTNDYYKLLFDEEWSVRKWNGPPQFEDKKTKGLMMLLTDMALTQDKDMRPIAQSYAKDQDLFFSDFSKYFSELLELGVPEKNFAGKEKLFLQTIEEQEDAAKAKVSK